ncbi:Chemotaxis protein methyltransferase [Candidatus Gugararchaeum adminiculabundum]|nr:Chemotaxis protein methyltransferase [Candidatus Gugararchaeum adminiculabundum]
MNNLSTFIPRRSPLNPQVEAVRLILGVKLSETHTRCLELLIRRRMDFFKLPYDSYLQLLKVDPEEQNLLRRDLTVNMTFFFRHPEHFDFLDDTLPVLLEQKRRSEKVSIVSVGCSIGCEPFSIAMAVSLAGLAERVKITAFDIDLKSLERAKSGKPFADFRLSNKPTAKLWVNLALKQGYMYESDAYHNLEFFQVSDTIRQMVSFMPLDILQEPPPEPADFLFCSNVLMHLDNSRVLEVFPQLYASVVPGGYILISPDESSAVRAVIAIPSDPGLPESIIQKYN